jgi:hypothetical protein
MNRVNPERMKRMFGDEPYTPRLPIETPPEPRRDC